jgi:drug/metabolite transporter (DMT)-like permease
MKKITQFTPSLQAILAAILFGLSTPFSKLLLGDIDSVVLAACLYLGSGIGAGLMLALFSQRKKGALDEARLNKKDLGWLLGAVFSGGIAAPILLLLALKHTPGSTASLLLNFESVATAFIAVVAFKEAVGKRVGVAIGLVTLASILLTWNGNGGWGFSAGALGVVGACVLWGVDNNFTRNISSKNPLTIVTIKGLGAGTFSLLLSLVLGKPLPALGPLLLALLLGFISYGMSIMLFIFAMRGLGAARTSTLFGSAPFIGMLVSIPLLHEVPQGLFYVAIPLMLMGAWLMLSEGHRHSHYHLPEGHEHSHTHPDPHHEHRHANQADFVGEHSHWHQHTLLEHEHPHAPDIHHRHMHED